MKIAYFDCFSGISGDMTIAALLDAGADEGCFRAQLDKLNLHGYEIKVGKKINNGIEGTDIQVLLHEDEHVHEHSHDSSHRHSHEHSHGHSHSHSHERNLKDIEEIINASSLSQKIKDFGMKVFHEIAAAEAKVHGKDINEVHFHEIGAIDSIVDIIGTAVCLDLIGVDFIYSSPLHDGKGFIECRHGIIPVPVPAVVEMLSGSGIPLISEDVETELVTPTGLGLIKCMASSFGTMPPMKINNIGYGMGKRDTGTGRLNALRVIIGEAHDQTAAGHSVEGHSVEGHSVAGQTAAGGQCAHRADAPDKIVILETNIDDMSPEILGYTAAKLIDAGALDAFFTPIYMKKGRPAYMLTVLAGLDKEIMLLKIILEETSTFGVRRCISERYCMERNTVLVDIGDGEVRIKEASFGQIRKYSPEYEDCRKIADKSGIPLNEVFRRATESYGGKKRL